MLKNFHFFKFFITEIFFNFWKICISFYVWTFNLKKIFYIWKFLYLNKIYDINFFLSYLL